MVKRNLHAKRYGKPFTVLVFVGMFDIVDQFYKYIGYYVTNAEYLYLLFIAHMPTFFFILVMLICNYCVTACPAPARPIFHPEPHSCAKRLYRPS